MSGKFGLYSKIFGFIFINFTKNVAYKNGYFTLLLDNYPVKYKRCFSKNVSSMIVMIFSLFLRFNLKGKNAGKAEVFYGELALSAGQHQDELKGRLLGSGPPSLDTSRKSSTLLTSSVRERGSDAFWPRLGFFLLLFLFFFFSLSLLLLCIVQADIYIREEDKSA